MRAAGDEPDIAHEDVLHCRAVTVACFGLEGDRLGGGFQCGEGNGPFLPVVGHGRLRDGAECHGYGDAFVGKSPHGDGTVALNDGAIAEVRCDGEDWVIGVGVLGILRFLRGSLGWIILLKDEFAIDRGEGCGWESGFVIEIRIHRRSAVGVLHAGGLGHFLRCHDDGIAGDHGFRGVPLPVFAAEPEMIQLFTGRRSRGFGEFVRFLEILLQSFAADHESAEQTGFFE